jgi:hypothetical protein
MGYSKRLTIIAFISVIGLWLIVAGAHAGTNQADLPAPSPTPEDLPADIGILPGAASPARSSLGSFQRIQTVTLEPRMSDLMSDTWPVRVQDVYYNWNFPAPTYTLKIPADAWDVSANTSSGLLGFSDGKVAPGPQDWITVTYRTMSLTWTTHAARSGNLVAMSVRQSFGGGIYDPLTCTLIYARQFPPDPGRPGHVIEDQWGYVPTYLELQSIEPTATERSDVESWARWVTTTNYFTSVVTLEEPLFGSDITVTQVEMDPNQFVLGNSNRFTVTIKNIGTMTASRWFYNELYVRPENDPPPQNAYDHEWGLITYQGDALLRKPGTEGDYKIEYLAPGSEIKLFTVITVTSMMTGGQSYRVYAQADTAYLGDPLRFAWFGTNPEGYGTAPYTQEQNLATYGPFVFNPEIYGVQVPSSVNGKAPSGHEATYWVPVNNIGNMLDTYTVTLAGGHWPITIPQSVGPVLNAQTTYLPITVKVPSGTPEYASDVVTITLTSNGAPASNPVIAQGTIKTTAGYYRLYLPIIRKKK